MKNALVTEMSELKNADFFEKSSGSSSSSAGEKSYRLLQQSGATGFPSVIFLLTFGLEVPVQQC